MWIHKSSVKKCKAHLSTHIEECAINKYIIISMKASTAAGFARTTISKDSAMHSIEELVGTEGTCPVFIDRAT